MNITIQRGDASYGPYTMEQVKTLMAQKRLAHDDLAYTDEKEKSERLEHLIIQDSFKRQRAAYIAANSNPSPDKKGSKKSRHAKRWLWKPEPE